MYKNHQDRKVDGARRASMYPLNQDCYKGEVKPVVHGSFYFAGRGETSVTISDFLSGSADSGKPHTLLSTVFVLNSS